MKKEEDHPVTADQCMAALDKRPAELQGTGLSRWYLLTGQSVVFSQSKAIKRQLPGFRKSHPTRPYPKSMPNNFEGDTEEYISPETAGEL